MLVDWFRGTAITVRFDDERHVVLFVANNGRVPTLEFAAAGFVSATADAAKLELVGSFERDTRIVLKLPPGDAQGIASTLCRRLELPRQPLRATVEELSRVADGTLVVVEGRCFPYADRPVMENRIHLFDVAIRIEHNAPYRVTGWWRQREREEIQVLAIEHLNPPVTWLTGETVRVFYAPERQLVGFAAVAPHRFTEPGGTFEMLLPPDTLASVAVDGEALVFEGDLSRTGYGTRVKLGPVSANDTRAIFLLLDERFQVPRTPRVITPADIGTIAAATLVQIDGTYRRGHVEGPNFEGGIQLQNRRDLEYDARYRVVGFLYPAFRPVGPFIGYTGPRLCPLTIARV